MEHQLTFLTSSPKKNSAGKKSTSPSEKKSKIHEWKLFVDGASRGNPGPSGAGIYITHNQDLILEKGFYLGKKTNNQAEYLALALGLYLITPFKNSFNTLHIISDSELLIKQMKGIYTVRDKILKLLKECIDDQLQDISVTFKHVVREKNKEADGLANEGIDKNIKVPTPFQNILKKYDFSL